MPTFTALNGRLPASVLTGLPWAEAAGFRLRADAAASAGRLAAAFRAHFNAPLLLTDAYRLFATQVALKASKGAWAAEPGTSNHGLGIAIDFASGINVDGSVQHRWMEANGPSFGWINPPWATNWNPLDGQHEPWHWEYDPARDQHIPAPTPPPVLTKPAPAKPAPPAPPLPEDDDMKLIRINEDGRIMLVGVHNFEHVVDMAHYSALAKILGPYVAVNINEAQAIHDQIDANIIAFAGSLKPRL